MALNPKGRMHWCLSEISSSAPDHSGAARCPWRYDHDLGAWNWSDRESVDTRPWKYLVGETQRLLSKETACRVSYCLKIHCTLQSSFSHFFLYKRGRCSFCLFRFLVSICDLYFLSLLESGYSISLIILLDSNLHTHSIDWFDYLSLLCLEAVFSLSQIPSVCVSIHSFSLYYCLWRGQRIPGPLL